MKQNRPATLDYLRVQLEEELGAIARAEGRPGAGAERSGGDLVDQAQGVELLELDAEHRERLARRAESIRRALVRMDAGSYGVCRECDEPISVGRLMAMPTAATCVPCQAQLEAATR